MTQVGVWLQILATLLCEIADGLTFQASKYGEVFLDTQSQYSLFWPPNQQPCWDPNFMGQNAKFYAGLPVLRRPEKNATKL